MTESEFLEDKTRGKVFLMPKQLTKAESRPQNCHIFDESREAQGAVELTALEKRKALEIRHLESKVMKNSLLSSDLQENLLQELDKDTVYSYFAEESEIRPRPKRSSRRWRDDEKKIEGQTSFIASRSPKENRRGKRNADSAEDDVLAQTRR